MKINDEPMDVLMKFHTVGDFLYIPKYQHDNSMNFSYLSFHFSPLPLSFSFLDVLSMRGCTFNCLHTDGNT